MTSEEVEQGAGSGCEQWSPLGLGFTNGAEELNLNPGGYTPAVGHEGSAGRCKL